MCGFILGSVLTLFGLANVWLLLQTGGHSDGPGALFFYIGAALGLFIGVPVLWGSLFGKTQEIEVIKDQGPADDYPF